MKMSMVGTWLALVLLLGGCAANPVPYPERLVFPPLEFEFPTVEVRTLATGASLYLKPDTELPLVELTLMIPGGSLLDPAGQEGMSELMAAALRSGGAGTLGPAELDRTLEQMAAELSVVAESYHLTVRMSLRSADLERGLTLLEDLLRRPGYDPARLETVRNQMLEGVRRRNDEPGAVAGRLLSKAVYGDHPLGRISTRESLTGISRDQLLARHRAQMQAKRFWLGVSGDFDPEALEARLNQMLADWPAAPTLAVDVPPLATGAAPGILTVDKDLPQTTILMGALGLDKSAPDLHAARVMNYILGGGGFNSHLMREIRSNRGLAYSVYSYFQVGRRLTGLFVAGAETKTSSTLEVLKLMQQEMERMKAQPVAEDELNLAKDSLINSFIFAFEGTHSVVEQQMRLDFFDYPPDYMESYRVKVAQVTAADVQQAALKYLQPDQMQVVLVGDMATLEADLATLGRPIHRTNLEEPAGSGQ